MTRLAIDKLLTALRSREKAYVAAFAGSGRLEELGAGNYYEARIADSWLISPAEWQVLRFILEHFPPSAHIVEIGCGWGQLLAMAAAAGNTCSGLDLHAGRLEGAKFLRNLVDSDFNGTGKRLDYKLANFPANWEGALPTSPAKQRGPTIGLFCNLGVGWSDEFCDACIAELRRFDFVIMDIVGFFQARLDLDTQQAFIGKLAASGLYYCGDIYSGGYYRFVGLEVGTRLHLQWRLKTLVRPARQPGPPPFEIII